MLSFSNFFFLSAVSIITIFYFIMTCKRIEIPKCAHKNRTVIVIIIIIIINTLALNQNLADIKKSSKNIFLIHIKYF